MHALCIRLVNPTRFHGPLKRQEEPEIAQVDLLMMTTMITGETLLIVGGRSLGIYRK